MEYKILKKEIICLGVLYSMLDLAFEFSVSIRWEQ